MSKRMQEEGEEHVEMINQGIEEMEVKVDDETDIEGLKEMEVKVEDETDIEGLEEMEVKVEDETDMEGLKEMKANVEDETDNEGLKQMKANVEDETDKEGIEGRNEDFFGLCFSANKICLDESTKKLWSIARSKFQVFNSKLVKGAAIFAIKVHKGKVIDHLIGAATRLANSFNWDIIVASGLLQDSLRDSETLYKDLETNFGREVADLVTDVSKLTKLSEISREEQFGNSDHTLDLILAMVDPRAVTIKIAEHTEKMMRLGALSPENKQRFAYETLCVYVPLLERLNLNEWKAELQHLCFGGTEELRKLYASVSEYDEDGIAFKVKLEKALETEKLPYKRVEFRKKSLLSIQNKMSWKKYDFSKIRDIIGLRIIVKTVDECYKAKDVVRKLWRDERKFEKDYIQNPDPNGYKSLHIVVKNAKDQAMEVQIRTMEMHMESEKHHWAYKEGNLQGPEHVKMLVEWARWIIKWASEVSGVEGQTTRPCKADPRLHHSTCPYAKMNEPLCLAATDGYKFPGKIPVYVIVIANNKVAIEEHPSGTALKDLFLQRSWKGRVLVNGQDADLNYDLQVGDIIQFGLNVRVSVPILSG